MSSTTCPLCQQKNNCTSNHACWCMKESVPKALIQQARDKGIDEQCICQSCITSFKEKQKTAKPNQ